MLPGLDDLVRLSVLGGHDPDGVLDCNWDSGPLMEPNEIHEEVDTFLLPAVRTLLWEPPCSTAGEVGTRRERNHHLEVPVPDLTDIAFPVRTRFVGGQQVTRNCMMASGYELIPNRSAVFACNKDFQNGHL